MELNATQLADLADSYAKARDERLVKQKELAKYEETERDLKNQLIQKMVDAEVPIIGGSYATVTCKAKDVPTAEDWPTIHQFMKDNDAMDLMQKRLHEGAVKERWDDEVEIPGVGHYTVHKLSIGAAKI